MKRSLVLLSVFAALLSGCADAGRGTGDLGSEPTPTPSETEADREVAIYSSVVRQLVMKDHTFGGGASPFKHVYIVDAAVSTAGDPMGKGEERREPFDEGFMKALESELSDLPPIDFVHDPDDVRRGPDGMGGVENRGVIVTLAPIEGNGTKVKVPNNLWCGGLCGQWLTYVVELRDDEWEVTGTTGPTAIS